MSTSLETSSAASTPAFVVVGAGGLGCPALLGLLTAGARRLRIVDFDRVDASNLQRQVLFDLGDVGSNKAMAAARQLRRRSDALELEVLDARLGISDAAAFVDELGPDDVLLECSDHAELKFALHDACRARDRAFVVGGVVAWEGRAMAVSGEGACYRCIFEGPPPDDRVARCAEVGVMGAGAGLIGHLMANLAWQLAAKGSAAACDIAGRLHVFDFRDLAPRVLAPPARPDCPACGARLDNAAASPIPTDTDPRRASA